MKVTIPSGLINEKVFSKQSVFDRTRLGGKVGKKIHRLSLARALLCFYAVADFLCGSFSNTNDFLLRATRHSNPCARPQPFHSAFPCCVPQFNCHRTAQIRKMYGKTNVAGMGFWKAASRVRERKKNGREVKANRRYIYIH